MTSRSRSAGRRAKSPTPMCSTARDDLQARRRAGGRARRAGSRPPSWPTSATRSPTASGMQALERDPAAGAVRRAAHRFQPGAPEALHRHAGRALPALHPVHQLRPLCRRVRALGGRRAAGAGQPLSRRCRPPAASIVTRRHRRRRGGRSPTGGWRRHQMPAYHLMAPSGDGHHPGQHRRRPVQRQDDLRPPGGAAARGLADDRPLRRPARQPDDRRLCPRPRLSARRPCARRRAAARRSRSRRSPRSSRRCSTPPIDGHRRGRARS